MNLIPRSKPGMSAKAEILVGQLDNVLAVPLQAIFATGGSPYVFVGNADHFEKRFVTTGQSNSTRIEIKSGLQPGDIVLLSRPKNAPDDKTDDNQNSPDKKNIKTAAGGSGGGAGGVGGGHAKKSDPAGGAA